MLSVSHYQPICSLCNTESLVLPCVTCHRPQCETCFFTLSPSKKSCEGCRLERFLEMDRETEYRGFQFDEEVKEEEGKEEGKEEEEAEPGNSYPPMVFEEFGPGPSHPDYPQEYVEAGTIIFRPILYPTEEDWKYATQILESQILFTTSDSGPQPPQLYTRYLVGRIYHSYPTSMTTDYMLSYEHHPHRPSEFIWIKYMATYYNKSPMPHEKNMFYPHPLPLRFSYYCQ